MGFTAYNPFKGIANTVKTLFSNPTPAAPTAPTPQPTAPSFTPSYGQNFGATPAPQYYQVKRDDTFDSIGEQFGLPASRLQEANGVVPPPKGSFIEIPRLVQQQSQAYANQGQMGMQSYLAGEKNLPVMRTATGPNSFTNSLGGVNTAELVSNIMNSPTTPSTIPGAVLNQLTIGGMPATPQLMIQNGYTFNQATGSWVQGNGAPGGNNAGGGGEQITDPSKIRTFFHEAGGGGFETTLKWARNAYKRQRRRGIAGSPQKKEGKTGNTGNAITNTLDIHLGSG